MRDPSPWSALVTDYQQGAFDEETLIALADQIQFLPAQAGPTYWSELVIDDPDWNDHDYNERYAYPQWGTRDEVQASYMAGVISRAAYWQIVYQQAPPPPSILDDITAARRNGTLDAYIPG
jgi:hypothetical protein